MEVFDVRKIHLSIHAFHFGQTHARTLFVSLSVLFFICIHVFFSIRSTFCLLKNRNTMPRQTENKCSLLELIFI